jgi:hypothetical protein
MGANLSKGQWQHTANVNAGVRIAANMNASKYESSDNSAIKHAIESVLSAWAKAAA